MSERYFRVAVNAPLPEALTYSFSEVEQEIGRGTSVLVPLGRGSRKIEGIVLEQLESPGPHKLKSIFSVHPERPRLSNSYVSWLEWIAAYYCHPIGQVFASAFPPLKKTGRQNKTQKPPVIQSVEASTPLNLMDEQRKCYEDIRKNWDFQVHLLHGVTGSGKTEVYLRLLQDCLEQKKTGIVLVPEISLTPQLLHRFSARFGDSVAVIHSHLTEREKTNQWWAAVDKRTPILVGARSALFCPIENLGLIIIDEEHEPSFKQDEKFKYHARDAAIMLAKQSNCPIVLGSATPSLESWKNAMDQKYQLHQMKHRVSDRSLPEIAVLDLKDHKPKDRPFWLTALLEQEITETLQRKEQVALFLNRRGVAQTVLCDSCGFTHECPNCAIGLTLHGKSHLVCHYCEYSAPLTGKCPDCSDGILKAIGLGTESIEQELAKIFPEARLARADRDEISNREQLEEFIRKVEHREVDILIGTQMIAKGLDFPGLTLVGLVLADVGFHLPDFRASERSFQLLTQMSGRSGRHSEKPGRVIIQTYNPDHPSIVYTQQKDFESFANEELGLREPLGYPPFGRLAMLRIQGLDFDKSLDCAKLARSRANQLLEKLQLSEELQILGPSPAPLSKLRGQFRFQVLIKSKTAQVLSRFLRPFMGDQKWIPAGTKVQVDVDPMNMM